MKYCWRCGQSKDDSEFSKNRRNKDGLSSECRKCGSEAKRQRRLNDPERAREVNRQSYMRNRMKNNEKDRRRYYSNPSRRREIIEAAKLRKVGVCTEKCRSWRSRYPEKYRAQTVLGNAIRDGLVKKGPCERCASQEHVHGHHNDYSRPLDVVWLCATCHGEIHRKGVSLPGAGGGANP